MCVCGSRRGQGPSRQRFPGASATFERAEETLQARLHAAKQKITKEEVQEKQTELHRKQRKGKKGPAGQVFQAINSEGGGLEGNLSETYQNTKQADMP